MSQILDMRMGFPKCLSLNVVISYSCLKQCKIDLKCTIDVTFQDCFTLSFCDVIGDLHPEWACRTLLGGTTFRLASNLADIPISRVRKKLLQSFYKQNKQGIPCQSNPLLL